MNATCMYHIQVKHNLQIILLYEPRCILQCFLQHRPIFNVVFESYSMSTDCLFDVDINNCSDTEKTRERNKLPHSFHSHQNNLAIRIICLTYCFATKYPAFCIAPNRVERWEWCCFVWQFRLSNELRTKFGFFC